LSVTKPREIGDVWSARIGLHYRALATESGSDLVWFWIGPHAEYDKLVGRKPANPALQPSRRAQNTGSKKKRHSRPPRG
jgi:hypothetical protein